MRKILDIIKAVYLYIQPYLKNKYLVAIVLFIAWIIFFDQNNMLERIKLARDVNKLSKDMEYYQQQIKSDSARLIELKTSPGNLEKFAREQYLMKKDNEEIFIIVEEEDN